MTMNPVARRRSVGGTLIRPTNMRTRTWPAPAILLALTETLFGHAYGNAQTGPQPPCGQEPAPPYPGLGTSPRVTFWSESDLGQDWRPPACTGWAATGFATLVTTVGQFPYALGADGLVRRIGAISQLAGIRYWSTTHNRWQTLIVDAHSLTGAQSPKRRGDFTPDEMTEGKVLYFEQSDNLSGKAVYRMHIIASSADRLVFDVENVTIIRYLLVPLFHPGEMQSIYFLNRGSNGVWRYYSIARTGRNSSRLAAGHAASSVNRAVAFYRSLVGVPTDLEPPAAP